MRDRPDQDGQGSGEPRGTHRRQRLARPQHAGGLLDQAGHDRVRQHRVAALVRPQVQDQPRPLDPPAQLALELRDDVPGERVDGHVAELADRASTDEQWWAEEGGAVQRDDQGEQRTGGAAERERARPRLEPEAPGRLPRGGHALVLRRGSAHQLGAGGRPLTERHAVDGGDLPPAVEAVIAQGGIGDLAGEEQPVLDEHGADAGPQDASPRKQQAAVAVVERREESQQRRVERVGVGGTIDLRTEPRPQLVDVDALELLQAIVPIDRGQDRFELLAERRRGDGEIGDGLGAGRAHGSVVLPAPGEGEQSEQSEDASARRHGPWECNPRACGFCHRRPQLPLSWAVDASGAIRPRRPLQPWRSGRGLAAP